LNQSIVKRIEDAILPPKTDTAPFVPQAEMVPPAVDRFVGVIDKQFRKTHDDLLRSASLLESKAAELRRRADDIMRDRMGMEDAIKNSVRFEEECRHVAQSLSMIPVQNGE
jgi:hypothetical protein